MEKPKQKKSKISPLRYPAPYSQSWYGPASATMPRRNIPIRTLAPHIPQTNKPGHIPRRSAEPQRRYLNQDPTAPHLKYGLFPKRVSRGQSLILNSTALKTQGFRNTEMKREQKKTPKQESATSEAPIFVFRSLEHKNLRKLCVSASTHLDIKPKRMSPLLAPVKQQRN